MFQPEFHSFLEKNMGQELFLRHFRALKPSFMGIVRHTELALIKDLALVLDFPRHLCR